jgi:hypothetical protein
MDAEWTKLMNRTLLMTISIFFFSVSQLQPVDTQPSLQLATLRDDDVAKAYYPFLFKFAFMKKSRQDSQTKKLNTYKWQSEFLFARHPEENKSLLPFNFQQVEEKKKII